jgi:hypothetical protein
VGIEEINGKIMSLLLLLPVVHFISLHYFLFNPKKVRGI